MLNQSRLIRVKRKTLVYLAVLLIALAVATPAFAYYLGPNRTVDETTSVCKVLLNECQYVPSKNIYTYKVVNDWSCSNESKPWRDYSSQPTSQGCFAGTNGDQFWEREDVPQQVTNTYPPATINGTLQNCTLQNGWCATAPTLFLSGSEPVSGHSILAIEGSLNGQTVGCSGSSCNVPLNEGTNNFTYWALSSWGDSSTMGTVTAKVDSQPPSIGGTFSGTLGSNGWYIAPVSFTSNASDSTSGLASFTCSLDGVALPSCSSISVSAEGAHTVVLTARDNAGNARVLMQSTSLDTQNPVLNASVSGTMGSNNWYTDAAFNASASDAMPGSGLVVFEYNLDNNGWVDFPASDTLDLPDGSHTVDIRAMDNAGRTVSVSKSFRLDSAAPSVLLNPDGIQGSNDWYTTNLTLAAYASDSLSGIDIFDYSLNNSTWTTYTAPLTLLNGAHNVSFWAQDQAGLVTQVDSIYQVDTRPPQIAGSINGTPGANGWFVSDVTLSASAADPLPGSGMETFAYILNGAAEIPFTDSLTLKDGQHIIRLDAKDKAGLTHFIEQTVKVDTARPSLIVDTVLPNWIKDGVVLSGTSSDSGSSLSKVEISIDGGQTWQVLTDLTSWNYDWDTRTSPNGSHTVHIRVTDQAGLTTEKVVSTGVDNQAPSISMPGSWYQWDTITLDVWDSHSGLAEVQVEISDPEGRWQKRVIPLDSQQFPLALKWDRYFGDGTVAPWGTYDVNVVAFDKLGHSAVSNASVTVLLDILPAGPTATSQPTSSPKITLTPAYPPTFIPSPTATQTSIVNVFGGVEPGVQTTLTPTTIPVQRSAPTRTSILDRLDSFFVPNSDSTESVAKIGLLDESKEVPDAAAGRNPSVLWGAAAAAMASAVTAYALEEKRKQQEERARQAAAEAEEEERRAKMQARQIEKMDAKRAQEKAWEETRTQNNFATSGMNAKLDRDDADGDAMWAASQMEIRKRYEDKKSAEEEKKKAEELKAGLQAYYAAMQPADEKPANTQSNWWEKTKSFVGENIIQPVSSHVYQPFIAPILEHTATAAVSGASWLDKNVYEPLIKPAMERIEKFVLHEAAWLSEVIYQPHIKPAIEKTKQFVINETAWINEKVYQPHIQPAMENTKQFIISESAWINEKVYQPFIQPAVEKTKQFVINESTWINEKIYQPYIKPIVDKRVESVINKVSWINKNLYQPYLEPVVSDINQYVYRPYVKPLLEKASTWWEKYGEWVHGALDTVGFVPGLGEIADGLNGLIYLGEGRYLEASVSAISMIPLLGDLGKAGKWSLNIGQEVLQETTEKAAKEIMENGWAHVVLDAAGAIPGAGKFTNSLNGLVHLERGRYLQASFCAVSLIPIVGDLVKIGLEVGMELLGNSAERIVKAAANELAGKAVKESFEEAAEKLVRDAGEGLLEKAANETLEVATEKTLKETGEELVGQTSQIVAEKATKETLEEVIEKTLHKTGDELADQTLRASFEVGVEKIIKETGTELLENSVKEGAENVVAKVAQDTIPISPVITTNNISNTVVENVAEETLEQVSEKTAQFISSLTAKYGKDMVEKFLPFCKKYDIDPYEVLTRPPVEGQSLIGWGLDIANPGNPVNHPLVQLNLTKDELNNILEKSIQRPNSKVVVLGYGGGSAKPYYVLSDEIDGCHLSLSAETWKPFENARTNFWVDINTPFIEKAVEDRKIFLFNVESDVITSPRNGERFSLPELRLIEMEKNNYVQVPVGEYSAFVPVELLDTYQQHLPMSQLSKLGGS